MPDAVLALNAGSSSIKFGVFEPHPAAPLAVVRGAIDGIGGHAQFTARDGHGTVIGEHDWGSGSGHDDVLRQLLAWIDAHLGDDRLVAAGHRVVHGGADFTAPVRLDAGTLAALAALTPLAPLHQPHSLAPVRAIMALRPGLPQVACFDTAFHHTMPAVATRLPLPGAYAQAGLRRYGFHGLSYEYIARTLRAEAPALAAGRVIVAHLGNGASLCAMQDGRSVDTTMSFTALDGLVMGTRCGALDPGVVLYLMQEHGLTPDAIEALLYHQSGLLGVSGTSGDMRVLLDSADPRAADAVELFVYSVARFAAAMAGAMGGLDGFVFTAGIGEHAAPIRAAICHRLAWLGAVLDQAANDQHAGRIGTAESRVDLRMLPTDEEAMIARHTLEVLGGEP